MILPIPTNPDPAEGVRQEIAAKHFCRPSHPNVGAKYAKQFAQIALFRIDEAYGGWQKAARAHFADGATFDQIYQPGRQAP